MKKEDLPNNIEELQKLLLKMSQENQLLKQRNDFLEAFIFARKTEKKKALEGKHQQLSLLFNEAEAHADDEPHPHASHTKHPGEKTHSPRGHRNPLPKELRREEILIDISEEEKTCACGSPLKIIRKEISEKLCIIPRKVYVQVFVRPAYACPCCEGTESDGPAIKIAPMPPQLIKHGIASPEMVTTVIIDKFCDALPLYRQSAIYERVNIKASRATLSRWIQIAAKKCAPLYERLYSELLTGHVIHMDETRIQVLREDGRSDDSISTMWVMCGGNEGKVRYFHYDASHAGAVAARLLTGFNGYLMTDGLKAYDRVGEREGLIHVSCLVHMRRKFATVSKAAGKTRKKGISDHILELIAKLYDKEKKLRLALDSKQMSPEQFKVTRITAEQPILDNIKLLLEQHVNTTPPKSALGEAISYALRHWDRMVRYLECPDLPPDNNEAENAIRPFAVGRKNWLFAGSPVGADASALFYTLIESAKVNKVNVEDYLLNVLRNIAAADTPEKIEALLPWNFKS